MQRMVLFLSSEKIRAAIAAESGSSVDDVLPRTGRCLSPSDFGFHNALLAANGRLHFFDFEYAGWDDPAKLACDFFCQPQIPVSETHWDQFVPLLDRALGCAGTLIQRARRLLPAYRIKWCCIMLNDFVRSEIARREFSLGPSAGEDRKQTQLKKSQRALARLR